MSKVIRIKKGLDISLQGKPEQKLSELQSSKTYALKPTDIAGLTPKVKYKAGEKVKAGTPLFYDKYNESVVFTSPVSGTLTAINRGERRKILEFVVEADSTIEYEQFKKGNPKDFSEEEIKENILNSGCWAFIMQRPFAVIANPNETPRDIFITAFNSAPLAPDYDFIVKEEFSAFQTGVDALAKLTKGKVYLGIKSNSSIFAKTKNVEINEFHGPHPAGNVGVQLNKIKPINKGEVVWTLNAADVIIIGRLFEKGVYDATRIIALAGSEVKNPKYYKTMIGASIASIVDNNIEEGDVRIISGNILTGEKVEGNSYLGFYDSQITVIPEGNKAEFMGWGMPGFGKFSMTRTFFSWLSPKKELKLTTKMHGAKRPFIVTGELEKVFPMDIFPMQLLKAVKVRDLELMEELGIYEVAEEDFALCEVINTSKIEIQRELREGFQFMIKELG